MFFIFKNYKQHILKIKLEICLSVQKTNPVASLSVEEQLNNVKKM